MEQSEWVGRTAACRHGLKLEVRLTAVLRAVLLVLHGTVKLDQLTLPNAQASEELKACDTRYS